MISTSPDLTWHGPRFRSDMGPARPGIGPPCPGLQAWVGPCQVQRAHTRSARAIPITERAKTRITESRAERAYTYLVFSWAHTRFGAAHARSGGAHTGHCPSNISLKWAILENYWVKSEWPFRLWRGHLWPLEIRAPIETGFICDFLYNSIIH